MYPKYCCRLSRVKRFETIALLVSTLYRIVFAIHLLG